MPCAQVVCSQSTPVWHRLRAVKCNRVCSDVTLVDHRRECGVELPPLDLHCRIGSRVVGGSDANLNESGNSQQNSEEFSHC